MAVPTAIVFDEHNDDRGATSVLKNKQIAIQDIFGGVFFAGICFAFLLFARTTQGDPFSNQRYVFTVVFGFAFSVSTLCFSAVSFFRAAKRGETMRMLFWIAVGSFGTLVFFI